jgi:hypothetical protein
MSPSEEPQQPEQPGRREKRQPFGRADAPSSNYYILDRLNEIAMQVYGSSARSRQDLEGAPQSAAAQEWYQQVQEHFDVEKDEHGNEYLYHRDGSPPWPRGSTERNG